MDLDGDGHLDLISGSWPGEIFFFRGRLDRTFADPVKLKNKLGKTINIGGGLQQDDRDYILVAGDAKYEKNNKGQTVIRYEGETIVVPEGKQAGITGTASAVHAVDWNGDGKLDLLVGNINGKVHLVPNEATGKGYAFGKEQPLMADGAPIQAPGGDAGPFAADWDGDGKLDLLVGSGDGSVWFYRNVGTATAPKLAKGVQLIPPGENRYGEDAPMEPRRGTRAKVCAVDMNGDGRLDLLVGDYTTQRPYRPDPTPEEKVKQDKARKQYNAVMTQYSRVARQLYGPKALKAGTEKEKAEKEMKGLMAQMSELRKQVPQEYESHGWVWMFKRQPADATRGQ